MTEPLEKRLERLEIESLKTIYKLVDQLRSDEIVAANRGTKISLTRMRKTASEISKQCKLLRQELLSRRNAHDGRDGKIRSGRGEPEDRGGEETEAMPEV